MLKKLFLLSFLFCFALCLGFLLAGPPKPPGAQKPAPKVSPPPKPGPNFLDLVIEKIWGEFNVKDSAGNKHYFIYFNIKNQGLTFFNGILKISASISPSAPSYPRIRINYQGQNLTGNPLLISGFFIKPGETFKFDLEGPGNEWVGNTYNCTISFSTSSSVEVSTNNSKTQQLILPKQ